VIARIHRVDGEERQLAQICAVDPYCCNNSWDAICVGEVASVCGGTCN